MGGESQISLLFVGGEFDVSAGRVGAVPFVHAVFLFFSAFVHAVDDDDGCHNHWVKRELRRVPMGMTVAKIMMVVVERPPLLPPPLPPLSGTLLPPLGVTVDLMTPMLAMVPPCLRALLRLDWAVTAELEPEGLGEVTSMLTVTEPETMETTRMLRDVTPAAEATELMKLT